MRVLLINPPYPRRAGSSHVEPIGLAGMAAMLRQEGIAADILDLAASLPDWPLGEDRLPSLVEGAACGAGLVGIGPVATATLRGARAAAQAARAACGGPIVVGGPLCAAPGFEAVAAPYLLADAWVAGDGEDPVVAIAQAAAAGGWPAAGQVPGVGLPGHRPPEPYRADDLDRLPVPDRAALGQATVPSARRGLGRSRTTAAFLSRGCPYACTFCAAPLASGRRVRRFSPARVAAEVASCQALGYDDIVFYDDCLFVRGAALDGRIAEFAGALRDGGWTGTFQLELRCDAVVAMGEAALDSLVGVGLRQVNMGIEKGHVSALKQMRKRLTPDIAWAACQRLNAARVRAAGTFILGGIGEGPQELEDTVAFACSLPLDFAHFNPLAVYPGTQLYDDLFGAGAPWLNRCLDPQWAPRGDILWRSDEVPLAMVGDAAERGYERFYDEARLAALLPRLPVPERRAAALAYERLAADRGASLTAAPAEAPVPGAAAC